MINVVPVNKLSKNILLKLFKRVFNIHGLEGQPITIPKINVTIMIEFILSEIGYDIYALSRRRVGNKHRDICIELCKEKSTGLIYAVSLYSFINVFCYKCWDNTPTGLVFYDKKVQEAINKFTEVMLLDYSYYL